MLFFYIMNNFSYFRSVIQSIMKAKELDEVIYELLIMIYELIL